MLSIEVHSFPKNLNWVHSTPGAENDCSGPNFFLEEHLSVLADPYQNKAFDEENIEDINALAEKDDLAQCTASSDVSSYSTIHVAAIEKVVLQESEIAEKGGCSALNLGSDDGNIADSLDRTNRRKRRLSDSAHYEEVFEWETTSNFQ